MHASQGVSIWDLSRNNNIYVYDPANLSCPPVLPAHEAGEAGRQAGIRTCIYAHMHACMHPPYMDTSIHPYICTSVHRTCTACTTSYPEMLAIRACMKHPHMRTSSNDRACTRMGMCTRSCALARALNRSFDRYLALSCHTHARFHAYVQT